MTNKNKKPARVRRQKLHVVDSPVCETKQRNFWGLFPNVKNPKWDAIMRKGNYFDDFIKIIEELSEENFSKLFGVDPTDCAARLAKVRSAIRDFKLEQYDEEIYYLLKLMGISQKAVAVPVNRDMKDFKSRITLGEGTKRLAEPASSGNDVAVGTFIKKAVASDDLEVVDVGAPLPHEGSTDGEWDNFFADMKKESFEDSLKEFKNEIKIEDLKVENKVINIEEMLRMQASSSPSPIAPSSTSARPSLHNIFESKENVERRKIHRGIYEMNDRGEYTPFIAESMTEVVDTPPSDEKIVAFSAVQKPQYIVDIESAQALLDRFDGEYAKRQYNVIDTKRKMKEEKKVLIGTPSNHDYATSLDLDIKAYLKAQREFDMIKKIWSQARAQFKDAKIEEVDTVALANEIQKLARFDVNHIFDDMYPSVELHQKEMNRRTFRPLYSSKSWSFKGKQKTSEEVISKK